MKKVKNGFTLAEVLITLAIIGVVAAMAIPSVIVNTQQAEFRTGLKKAVSVLNSAIQMNYALEGDTPLSMTCPNQDFRGGGGLCFFKRHMSVIKEDGIFGPPETPGNTNATYNISFYTTDGMRFEVSTYSGTYYSSHSFEGLPLYGGGYADSLNRGNNSRPDSCGSYGIDPNDNTGVRPCFIMVDVNGDRKPNSPSMIPSSPGPYKRTYYKSSDPNGDRLTDVFNILITDKAAIPYGTAAQRAMYNAK